MPSKRTRGYVEVGQMFGWIIFLVIAVAGIYYGKVLYDSYQDGNAKGTKAGQKYQQSPQAHLHGAMFENALTDYLHVNRDKLPDRSLKDKAYNQGWDDGFHTLVDRIPR